MARPKGRATKTDAGAHRLECLRGADFRRGPARPLEIVAAQSIHGRECSSKSPRGEAAARTDGRGACTPPCVRGMVCSPKEALWSSHTPTR